MSRLYICEANKFCMKIRCKHIIPHINNDHGDYRCNEEPCEDGEFQDESQKGDYVCKLISNPDWDD